MFRMLFRNLFYVSKILQSITGKSVYRLSAMYEKPIKEPELELVVTVLNINPGNIGIIVD